MTFSPEQLNLFKFAVVVLDEFPVALRCVFASMWDTRVASPPGTPNWDDSETVLKLLHAKEGPLEKESPLKKSFKEWDCTALFRATLFSRTFAKNDSTGKLRTLKELYVKRLSSGTFHPSVVSPTKDQDETYALALDQLRLLRNSLFHQNSTQNFDKATFDNYIRLAKDAFIALRQDTTRIDEIGMLGEEDFPTKKQQQLEDALKKAKDAAIKFKQIEDLTEIKSEMKAVGSDVKHMKTEVTDINTTVKSIESNVARMRQAMEVESSKGVSGQYAEPAPMENNLAARASIGGVSKEGKRKRSLSPPTPQDSKRLKGNKVVKDGSPTDEELHDLSEKIAEKWKPLGRKLKIEEAKLTKFERENHEYDEQALKMLLHWKDNDGSAATYQVLNEALKRVGRTDLAEDFCQVVQGTGQNYVG